MERDASVATDGKRDAPAADGWREKCREVHQHQKDGERNAAVAEG